jgi:hypothetical protein
MMLIINYWKAHTSQTLVHSCTMFRLDLLYPSEKVGAALAL